MTSQTKCCERCKLFLAAPNEYKFICADSSCACHTDTRSEYEKANERTLAAENALNDLIDKTAQELISDLPSPEKSGWEEEWDEKFIRAASKVTNPKNGAIEYERMEWEMKSFIRSLLSDQEAKSYDKGKMDAARQIGYAASTAGLSPHDLAIPEDWQAAVDKREATLREEIAKKIDALEHLPLPNPIKSKVLDKENEHKEIWNRAVIKAASIARGGKKE